MFWCLKYCLGDSSSGQERWHLGGKVPGAHAAQEPQQRAVLLREAVPTGQCHPVVGLLVPAHQGRWVHF